MSIRAAAVFILCVLFPAVSQAWWNEEWNYRKSMKVVPQGFDAAQLNALPAAGGEPAIPEIPVLIRLHSGNFGTYFMDAQQNGNDVRFIAGDDKTALKFHIEKWDALNNMALVWVKVPIENTAGGPNGGEKIWMYYGNQNAVKGDDIGGSYDAETALLYHFENEAGGVAQDRTAYALNPDPASYSAEANLASLIGVGAKFNGNSSVKVPAALHAKIDPTVGWTFSTWIKTPAAEAADATAPAQPANDTEMTVLNVQDGGNNITLNIQGSSAWAALSLADGQVFETPRTAVVTPGAWKNLSLVVGSGALTVYVDGRSLATVQAPLVEMQSTMAIGSMLDGSKGLIAEIDEVQVSKIARTPNWLKAMVLTQGPGAQVVAYGDDEVYGSDESMEAAYLLTILKSVDTIGWTVIGILMLMALLCVIVIISKQMFLSKVAKSNAKFLEAFRGLENNAHAEHDTSFLLGLLKEAKKFKSSCLYHIYAEGANELRNKIGSTVGAQASDLRQQSVDSIKAMLDAAMIRELQRLNSQIVLLTISISGGPFLGLLGTVLGVMITFAAIAATGDVNISAIAPGVSAALMTTVAGLIVAIPALFAYNWLNTKIRNISIDMRVFSDEMISKIAEHHS
mgnify:FL=1